MSTCAKSGLGACGDAGSRARLPGIAPGSRFVRACWAVVREGSRSAAPHPPPEKTGPSEWPRWMALHSDGRLRTAWPITSEQKSESAERLHATVGGPPALLLRSKWPTQQCLNNQPLRAWGRSSAPSLELALRLGWASLRPDPSSGMRVPWHLLPLDRRAARSSRRSLGVDHMAISGPRLLLLLAFMLTLISVTPPALDRLPWQGRRRTNKCRCAAMVSRGTQTALPRAQGPYRRLPPLSRFRGQQPPLLLLSRSPCWMGNDPRCYRDGRDSFSWAYEAARCFINRS